MGQASARRAFDWFQELRRRKRALMNDPINDAVFRRFFEEQSETPG